MRRRATFPTALLVAVTTCGAALPPVTVTAVLPDTDSVKIRFAPVPGAADYRVYDVSDPVETKYAGLVHVFAPWGTHFVLAPDSAPGAANGDERVVLSPVRPVSFDGGRILHVTFEADGQVDGRRWFGMSVAPAAAPLATWYSFNGPISALNEAMFVQVFGNNIARDLMSPDPANPTGAPIDLNLATSWPNYGLRSDPWTGAVPYASGHGLDDRSRFDVFLSETRMRIFEDGRPISDDTFAPLPWAASATVYFPHYLYHTANEIAELAAYAPYQTYWMDDVPYSDERHWNDMGYEVLPSGPDWNTVGNRIVMPPGAAALAVN